LARQGRYLLLIVDEAHRLPPDIFDQLRFLTLLFIYLISVIENEKCDLLYLPSEIEGNIVGIFDLAYC
jgi:hypothetical protein